MLVLLFLNFPPSRAWGIRLEVTIGSYRPRSIESTTFDRLRPVGVYDSYARAALLEFPPQKAPLLRVPLAEIRKSLEKCYPTLKEKYADERVFHWICCALGRLGGAVGEIFEAKRR